MSTTPPPPQAKRPGFHAPPHLAAAAGPSGNSSSSSLGGEGGDATTAGARLNRSLTLPQLLPNGEGIRKPPTRQNSLLIDKSNEDLMTSAFFRATSFRKSFAASSAKPSEEAQEQPPQEDKKELESSDSEEDIWGDVLLRRAVGADAGGDTISVKALRRRSVSVEDLRMIVSMGQHLDLKGSDLDQRRAQETEVDKMLEKTRDQQPKAKLRTVVQSVINAKRFVSLKDEHTEPGTPEEDLRIEFDNDNAGKKLVSAATTEGLVELLMSEGQVSLDYTHHFLSTYRYFMDAHVLLDMLIKRFNRTNESEASVAASSTHLSQSAPVNKASPLSALAQSDGNNTLKLKKTDGEALSMSSPDMQAKARQARVLNVVRMWVTRHPDDFVRDATLENKVKRFVDVSVLPIKDLARIGTSIAELAKENHMPREQTKGKKHPVVTSFVSAFKFTDNGAPVPSGKATKASDVLDIKADKLAQQLTLIEAEFFQRVFQDELVMQKWSKNKRSETAPNLLRVIGWFNHVSFWVATVICSENKQSQRVSLIKLFLEIAKYCLGFHNFSTTYAIVSGLMLSPVSRLKKTWKGLPSKSAQVFDDLVRFIQPKDNSIIYRSTLKSSGFPLVPYIGLHLGDLTFSEDGSPSMLSNNRVNFFKFTTIGNILNEIRAYQQADYAYKEDPKIISVLEQSMGTVIVDLKEMTRISRILEPPSEV